jgi:cysteinyl-tRNA synthetase
MSKSLGNFFTVRDVAGVYGYEPIRFFMLSAHYKNPINYSVDNIEMANRALDRIYNCKESLEFAIKNTDDSSKGQSDFSQSIKEYKDRFIHAWMMI